MVSENEALRYERQLSLPEIGERGQAKLKAAKVLMVGAGGLGCPALLYLAAAGVGTIGIIDHDTVELSNLQRQVLYRSGQIGQKKAASAAAVLDMLNPHVLTEPYPTRLSEVNAASLIGTYDLVLDGTDNWATRALIMKTCAELGRVCISGGVEGLAGQVTTLQPGQRHMFQGLNKAAAPDAKDSGVLGVVPGIIGTLMALEAIKAITGFAPTLDGRMLVFSARNMTMRMVEP